MRTLEHGKETSIEVEDLENPTGEDVDPRLERVSG
jgi:hypothetical protein